MTHIEIDNNVIQMAKYILTNQTTIRATAKHFNTPKSTVHHYLSHKLKYINYPLFIEVKKLLENNFNIKHLHGGESTKIKYQKLKCAINKNDELDLIC